MKKYLISLLIMIMILTAASAAYASVSNYGSPYTSKTYTQSDMVDGMTIRNGIDVSEWQGNIDWAKVKNAGTEYAIIRCGYRGTSSGGLNTDKYFVNNITNANANGVPVGIYFFSQATTKAEAIEEAEYTLKLIAGYDVDLPVVIDFEWGTNYRINALKGYKTKTTNVISAFCDTIADAGYTPMVYANLSTLNTNMDTQALVDKGYKIWVAQYNSSCNYTKTAYSCWQYYSGGSVAGISKSGSLDCDYWYGDDDLFNKTDTVTKPSKVTGMAASGKTKSSVTLTWNKVSNATGYYVYRSDSLNGTYKKITALTNNTYQDTGLSASTNYYYRVAAYNSAGIGTKSAKLQAKTLASVKPDKVTGIKRSARTISSITLSWTALDTADGYYIYRSTAYDGTYSKIATVKTNTYTNTGRTQGTTYYYKVAAYNNIGTGTESAVYTATALPKVDRYGTVGEEGAVMYKRAGTTFSQITTLVSGDQIVINARSKDKDGNYWYRGTFTAEDGTQYKGYVQESAVTITKKITTLYELNLRKGAGTSYGKYGAVPAGKTRIVYSTKTVDGYTWYKVTYTLKGVKRTGWICGYYPGGANVKIQNQ